MNLKKNLDIVKKVQVADFQGKSLTEKKPLYIEQNTFDVGLDTPIYRIMEIEHLLADMKASVLTHVKPCVQTWGDPYENPLTQIWFSGDDAGERVTLAGIVKDFYCLSWTLEKNESLTAWKAFSYGNPSVRVKTTLRKLLNKLMNIDDSFYMLHHYAGRVEYSSLEELKSKLCNTHYSEYLDSLGQGAVLSLMALRNCFADEKEVRLLYSYDPNSSPWVKDNVGLNGNFCKVPFEWEGVIDEVVFAPRSEQSVKSELVEVIKKNSRNCIISDSKL